MGWPTVNGLLLPMKGHYFLVNLGTSPIVPFLPTYAKQLGFSPLIVGTIYMILPIMTMVSKPVLCAIADRFMCQKAMFLTLQALSAILLFAIKFTPDIPVESRFELHCHKATYLVACNPFDPKSADLVQVEASYNATVLCDLNCELNNISAYYELCHNWRLPEHCSIGEKPEELNAQLTDKVFVNGEQSGHQPTHLEFTADIPMQHYEKEENCSYFHVKKGVMPGTLPHEPFCSSLLKLNCTVKCNNPAVMDLITRPTVDDNTATHSYQFWIFLLLLIVAWSSMTVVCSISNAMCFGILGDKRNDYGKQRLWGSVGWGLGALVAGLLVDELSRGKMKKDYTVSFYLVLIICAMSILVSSKLRSTQTQISENILKDIGLLFSSGRIILFVMWCITVGINSAITSNFLFWHIENLAGVNQWSKLLQGLVTVVQTCGGELPFFFLSGWILKRLDHTFIMSLVLVGFSGRFFCYSLLTNPWWFLPVELLQGVTLGLFYSTMTLYASVVSPPGTEATIQGLLGAVYEGVGAGLGSLIVGAIFQLYSGVVMFQVFGGISLVSAALYALVQILLTQSSEEYALRNCQKSRNTVPSAPTDGLYKQQIKTIS